MGGSCARSRGGQDLTIAMARTQGLCGRQAIMIGADMPHRSLYLVSPLALAGSTGRALQFDRCRGRQDWFSDCLWYVHQRPPVSSPLILAGLKLPSLVPMPWIGQYDLGDLKHSRTPP